MKVSELYLRQLVRDSLFKRLVTEADAEEEDFEREMPEILPPEIYEPSESVQGEPDEPEPEEDSSEADKVVVNLSTAAGMEVATALISANPDRVKYGRRLDRVDRLYPVKDPENPVTQAEFIEMIKRAFKPEAGHIWTISKRSEMFGLQNKSGKFPITVFIPHPDQIASANPGEAIPTMLTQGRNEGDEYEEAAYTEFSEASKGSKVSPLVKSVIDGISKDRVKRDLDPIDIVKWNVRSTGTESTKLPFTDEVRDVGETISDITLERGDDKVYISLKNKKGSTIANRGYSGKFSFSDDDSVVFNVDGGAKRSQPALKKIDEFLKALGVNTGIAAKGFQDYAKYSTLDDEQKLDLGSVDYKFNTQPELLKLFKDKLQVDEEKVNNFLRASVGMGYYYVREVSPGKAKVIPLLTREELDDFVGKIDVNSLEILYPEANNDRQSKGIELKVKTKGKEDRPYKAFKVRVRNTDGEILPNKMQVDVVKEEFMRKWVKKFLKK